MIISLKYAQRGQDVATIVVLMLHNRSSENCDDDGHFIASTALGGHRKLMARFLS